MNDDLKIRTKNFAVRVIKLYAALPKSTEAQVVGRQILRSGTSVGAQYRESQYAKSDSDFVSKIQGELQELEETLYWLDFSKKCRLFRRKNSRQSNKRQTNSAILITIAKKVKTRAA